MDVETRTIREIIDLVLNEKDEWKQLELENILQKCGTREVYDEAKKLCESGDSPSVTIGANILGQLGGEKLPFREETSTLLIEVSKYEKQVEALESVLSALGKTKTLAAIARLLEFADHESAEIRLTVVFGLHTLNDESSINTLIQFTKDEDKEIRDWATFGLGNQIDTDTPEIREALFSRLDDKNKIVRGEAFLGLAKRKDGRIIDPLVRELSGSEVAEQAVEAAELLANNQFCEPLKKLEKRWDVNPYLIKNAISVCCGQND